MNITYEQIEEEVTHFVGTPWENRRFLLLYIGEHPLLLRDEAMGILELLVQQAQREDSPHLDQIIQCRDGLAKARVAHANGVLDQILDEMRIEVLADLGLRSVLDLKKKGSRNIPR